MRFYSFKALKLFFRVIRGILWFANRRGTQQKILRKRPQNNNKAWIKLSEAILSILGDCWEKFICSSLPARLMEEFPASKVHLQPATWLTGKFHRQTYVRFECGRRAKFSPPVRGRGSIGNWVSPKGKIYPFIGGRGFYHIPAFLDSRHQIPCPCAYLEGYSVSTPLVNLAKASPMHQSEGKAWYAGVWQVWIDLLCAPEQRI